MKRMPNPKLHYSTMKPQSSLCFLVCYDFPMLAAVHLQHLLSSPDFGPLDWLPAWIIEIIRTSFLLCIKCDANKSINLNRTIIQTPRDVWLIIKQSCVLYMPGTNNAPFALFHLPLTPLKQNIIYCKDPHTVVSIFFDAVISEMF